jgi:hypothetical protein
MRIGIGISALALGFGLFDCKPESWTEADALGPHTATLTSTPFVVEFTVTSSVAIHSVRAQAELVEPDDASLAQGVLSMTLTDTGAVPVRTVTDDLESDAGTPSKLVAGMNHFCKSGPCVSVYRLEFFWSGPDPIDLSWQVNVSEGANGDKPSGAGIEIELGDGGVD